MDWKSRHLQPKVHQGLQALSAIGSSVHSFLGPDLRFKIVGDDDDQEGTIVSSPMELLQALDIQHPLGEVVLSACLTHHKTHGTCVTSLVAMAGYWSLAVQDLLNKGVPVSITKIIGDKCLELCIKTAQSQAIPCTISLSSPQHLPSSAQGNVSEMVLYSDGVQTFNVDLRGSGVNDSAAAAKFNNRVQPLHMTSNSDLDQSSSTSRSVPNIAGDSEQITSCDDFNTAGNGSSQLNLRQDLTQNVCAEGGGCSGNVSRPDFGFDQIFKEGDLDCHTTPIVKSSDQIDCSADTIATSVADAENAAVAAAAYNDVSWYFNADEDNELKQYKHMIEECTEKLFIGALDDVETGQTSLESDLKPCADVFSSNSELLLSENAETLDDFLKSSRKDEERTSPSVVSNCNIDDSDAEFDSCFDDLPKQDETVISSLHKFDDECGGNMKYFILEKGFETDPADESDDAVTGAAAAVDDDDDDDDFKDCFANDSAADQTKSITNDSDKTNLKEGNTRLLKIANACIEPELHPKHTEITGLHSKIKTPEPVHKILEILGHSMGRREQSASKKLLNNSRHFRTVESVVREHSEHKSEINLDADHRETRTRTEPHCSNTTSGSINIMLELSGHHQKGHPEQSVSQRLLNNSRHFRTIESVVEEHHIGGEISELKASKSGEIIHQEKSETEECLNDSRHFCAVESCIKEHDSEDGVPKSSTSLAASKSGESHAEEYAAIGWSELAPTSNRHLGLVTSVVGDDVVKYQTGEHGLKLDGYGETLKDGASLDSGLQSILQEKASLRKSSLHSRIVAQSRHLRAMDDEQCEKSDDGVNQSNPTVEQPDSDVTANYKKVPARDQEICITDIWDLGFGLSHGADHEMKLAVQTYMSQLQRNKGPDSIDGRPSFVADRVFVCCITGPSESHSSVVDGLVLPVKEYQICNIASQCGNRLNCLLINGDLKPTTKHVGYKESIKASRVYCNAEITDHQDVSVWMQQVMGRLHKLEIDILMIKGQADELILNSCAAQGIIVLQNLPHKALQGIAGDRDVVTYITDANQGNVIGDVNVRVWEQGWQAKPTVRTPVMERTHYVMVTSAHQLQTAVLCSPTITSLIGAESRFFKCLHRLSKAVAGRQVLPGAGVIEGAVIRCLDDVAEGKIKLDFGGENQHSSSWTSSVIQEYASSVTIAMRGGFIQYLVQTLQNSTDFGGNATELTALLEDCIKCSDDGVGIFPLFMTELGQDETDSNEMRDINSSTLSEVHTSSTENKFDQYDVFGRNIHGNIDSNIEPTCLSRPCSNTSKPDQRRVYDSYHGKLSAWECAWEIVRTVLQTDCVLISGIDKEHSAL